MGIYDPSWRETPVLPGELYDVEEDFHFEPEWTFEIDQRVTRPLYMDDGTWQREGDSCLDRSPLRRGSIVRRYSRWGTRHGDYPEMYEVRWDSGEIQDGFLPHGLDAA